MNPYNQGPKTQRARPPVWGEWCISLMGLVFTLATSNTLLDEINYRRAHFRPNEALSSSMDSTSNAHMPPFWAVVQTFKNSGY